VPDYTPLFLPGLVITMTAGEDITGGDPVEVSAPSTVIRAAAGSARYLGVAGADATTGRTVTVICDRVVHEGNADGAVNAGDQLTVSAKAGCQVKTAPPAAADLGASFTRAGSSQAVNDAITAARAVIGVALTTAADGTPVRWAQTR
jgi:hypothetical protein